MQTTQFHLFSLPPELLDSLTPRNLVNKVASRGPTPEPAIANTSSGPRACNICQGIIFLDVKEQRAHFRSDWHRYNIKTRLNGGKAVTEAAFSQLIDALEDSLSGSASSSDDDDDSDDAVNTLVNKTKRLTTRSPSPGPPSKGPPLAAITWFHSPPTLQIGVYRSIFSQKTDQESILQELRKIQTPVECGRTWAMFMVAGGHFAGAIVRVSKPEEGDSQGQEGAGRKKKQKKPRLDTEVLLHKTFHRYTTRRKQGGSQSANDNAKGPAKSAGALLRRYGEQALRDDIRGLLDEWSEYIASCERIWIRASTSNRRIFYDYDEAPFPKTDERLRTFPFPTRRPTQSELTRCLNELIHPKISHFTEEELEAQDDAYLASLPKPRVAPTMARQPEPEKPKQHKLSKEEELFRDKWDRLLEMVTKGRLEPLKAFLDKEGPTIGGVDAPIPKWVGDKRATILQVSVQNGHEEMTRWLLEEVRADPTIPLPSSKTNESLKEDNTQKSDGSDSAQQPHPSTRKTAYDLAPSKAIRDVFRRVAGAHPDWWDWFNAARVPSALTQEKEEGQEERKRVRKKGLKDRIKEREAKAKEDLDRPQTPPVDDIPKSAQVSARNGSSSHKLGGSGNVDGIAGLTPEMRLKVERERRARAAEARFKATGGG